MGGVFVIHEGPGVVNSVGAAGGWLAAGMGVDGGRVGCESPGRGALAA